MGNGTGKLDAELFQNDDGLETETSSHQKSCENDCSRFYRSYESYSEQLKDQLRTKRVVDEETLQPRLYREKTIQYLLKGIESPLSSSYSDLASSRPWILYWSLQALTLLGYDVAANEQLLKKCLGTIKMCQNKTGGFGGDAFELSHTAPTYAAVLSVITLGTEEGYKVIDRPALYSWLLRIKHSELKAFRVQTDGEIDTRGLYTVLAVASILNMLTPELVEGVAEFVGKCQTGEGGIGGEPGNEAHGGYAFCGLAALLILNRFDVIDMDAFTHWIVSRQMKAEGGFQGRTNKLVDSCYSFWQGAIPALLYLIPEIEASGKFGTDGKDSTTMSVEQNGKTKDIINIKSDQFYDKQGALISDQLRLQQYILVCCQFIEGGLRDKPSKRRDQYHTCYSLSGLSVNQHFGSVVSEGEDMLPVVWGDRKNLLERTDPIYNVETTRLKKGMEYFKQSKFASTHAELLAQYKESASATA
mmetsp:Transcript_16637/g.18843  ORF Transcript_16637/g.18843 Transcript_16637/m.18843 type:complete len:473 (+) Transcript_16637:77-1495(+)